MFGDLFPIETLAGAFYRRYKLQGAEYRVGEHGVIEIKLGTTDAAGVWLPLWQVIAHALAATVYQAKLEEEKSMLARSAADLGESIKAFVERCEPPCR